MAMHYENKYKPHNDSLANFANKFNSVGDPNLIMVINEVENFKDDASFIYTPEQDKELSIRMDWEKRFAYYDEFGGFRFNTLTQWKRKIDKPEIMLSIQCSTKGDGVLVAWHEDYDRTRSYTQKTKSYKNGIAHCEEEIVYPTHSYTEYEVLTDEGMANFKEMIKRAFTTKQFNFKSFFNT